jgi:hypothetical protein
MIKTISRVPLMWQNTGMASGTFTVHELSNEPPAIATAHSVREISFFFLSAISGLSKSPF